VKKTHTCFSKDSFSVRTHKALLVARCPEFAKKVLRSDYELSEVQLSTSLSFPSFPSNSLPIFLVPKGVFTPPIPHSFFPLLCFLLFFSSFTSSRSFSPSSSSLPLPLIRFCSGTQVEPAVLSAFLEYLYTDAVLGIEESITTDLIKMANKVIYLL